MHTHDDAVVLKERMLATKSISEAKEIGLLFFLLLTETERIEEPDTSEPAAHQDR